MPRSSAALMVPLAIVVLLIVSACGPAGGSPPPPAGDGVTVATVEPKAATPVAAQTGGKPADRPAATSRPAAQTSQGSRPTSGKWIDVDVSRFIVRLMDGETVVKTIGPVAVGEQIDTGAYLSTQTGLFHVYNKLEPLAFDAPYNTYISHWVGFDPAKDNGFHSFLKDATGKVVDASTGRVSNGCIRTGDAEAIYAFAEIGMPVFVHT